MFCYFFLQQTNLKSERIPGALLGDRRGTLRPMDINADGPLPTGGPGESRELPSKKKIKIENKNLKRKALFFVFFEYSKTFQKHP